MSKYKYLFKFFIVVLIFSMHMIIVPIFTFNDISDDKDQSFDLSGLKSEGLQSIFQPTDLNPSNNDIRYDIVTDITTKNIDDDSDSFMFINNIWIDTELNTDPLVVSSPSLYENGVIYPGGDIIESDALFIRIGNHGTNESSADTTLNANISQGISAGWQFEIPMVTDYEVINVSFKWRFEAPEGTFDNFTKYGDFVLDSSADYQEIRCRIKHPTNDSKSFWMGNPETDQNPNGTVFYRVGPNVTKNGEWYNFTYSFHAPNLPSDNYILELGAYLNTREYWNEYFDVWFDDIVIKGINDFTDNHPPIPTNLGLIRTDDPLIYNFWITFSDGIWESPIGSVIVYYNQTGSSYINKLETMDYQTSKSIVTPAGYNQTYWEQAVSANFDDIFSYKFVVSDNEGNIHTTAVYSDTIGDYSPPEITSDLDIDNINFVHQFGNGSVIISINASDWGDNLDEAVIFYYIDEIEQIPLVMKKISDFSVGETNYSCYQAKVNAPYGSFIRFSILVNDTEGNSKSYTEYKLTSTEDIVIPNIHIDEILASNTEEGETFVNVFAKDLFGEIENIYLKVKYVCNDSYVIIRDSDGTILVNYSYVPLTYNNITGQYQIRSTPTTPGGALMLNYDQDVFNANYSITAYVRDKKGNINSSTQYYVVYDNVAPRVKILDPSYTSPGSLRIWVQAIDKGSKIKLVTLEKQVKDGWSAEIPLKYDDKNGLYTAIIATSWFGNEKITYRINSVDYANNSIAENERAIEEYITEPFITTSIGLLLTEAILVSLIIVIFALIKMTLKHRVAMVRRRRFDIALKWSERLAYLGEEAIFGFIAAYGQRESASSVLVWEPHLIGNFYPYLKELIEKANNSMSFVMQTRGISQVTFIDFKIEEIGCSAITFAYPVSTLPQQWLSVLTLDHVPMGGGQGVLLLMLLMREQWTEVAHSFQEEITDGMLEIKNLLISGENKQKIIEKAREFRLFISGTIEVMDEIDIEADEISDEIMSEFEAEFLGSEDEDASLERSKKQSKQENNSSDTDRKFW